MPQSKRKLSSRERGLKKAWERIRRFDITPDEEQWVADFMGMLTNTADVWYEHRAHKAREAKQPVPRYKVVVAALVGAAMIANELGEVW
jgi:hypothetical protein